MVETGTTSAEALQQIIDSLQAYPAIMSVINTAPDEKKEVITKSIADFIFTTTLFDRTNPGSTDGMPRDFFRQNSYFTTSHKYLSEIFGTYREIKSSISAAIAGETGTHREDIDIKKGNYTKKIKPKKYFLSSVIPNTEIFEPAIQSIKTYCDEESAELVLLATRGANASDEFSGDVYKRFESSLATEFRFNNHLIAQDFKIAPQQIIPETGLVRFGQKNYCVIIASPKQNMVSVARGAGKHAHIIQCSGTISLPNYNMDRVGVIAEQDHVLGGLIVEVVNEKIFHTRVVQFDNYGCFNDINKYYTPTHVEEAEVEAIVLGDMHYPLEDKKAVQAQKECAKLTKPARIFFHDLCDFGSINHHEKNNVISRYFRCDNQKTLQQELDYLTERMGEWRKEFPDTELVVVPSNHDQFLWKWFNDGDFIKDEINARLGAELFISILDHKNPIAYYLEKNGSITGITFLKTDEGYRISDIECGSHGDLGSNGSRGSARSYEISHGNSIMGHTHSPQIFRSSWVVGTSSLLNMGYNKGPSSWLHAFAIVFSNGNRQLIISIDGKWKM